MEAVEKENKRRSLYAWVMIILVFILAISAIISGLLLIAKPDGDFLAMTVSTLDGSPFSNYLIPGIIMFLCLGVFPFIVGLGLVNVTWKWLAKINPFKRHYGAWTGAIVTGIILIIWIVVQIIMIGYISLLQPVMGIWGALILCLALLPQVRRYYRVPVIDFKPKRVF